MSNKSNFNRLKVRLQNIPPSAYKNIEAVIEANAQELATNASKLAPIDDGDLRSSIEVTSPPERNQGLQVTRAIGPDLILAPYAPYVEFGTKSRTVIPTGWSAFAAKFKGPSGRTGAFDRIMLWAKKKGYDETHAFNIFMKIMQYGSSPHPYLYPAFMLQKDRLLKDIRKAIKKSLK